MIDALSSRIQQVRHGNGVAAQLIRGGLGVGGLKVAQLLIALVLSVVLARGLGPEGFGQYSFVMTLIMIMALPFGQGLNQLTTREVAGYAHEQQWSLLVGVQKRLGQWSLMGCLILATVIGGIGLTQAQWAVNDRWTLVLCGLLMLPMLAQMIFRGALLRGLSRVVQAQVPLLLMHPLCALLAASFLLVVGWLNPVTALVGQLVAIGIAFAVATWAVKRYWPPEAIEVQPRYQNRHWLAAWGPFTVLMATAMLNMQVGILLLGWLGTKEQVAGFRLAVTGAQLIMMSLMVVNMVCAPYITHAYRDGNQQRLQRLSTLTARATATLGIPVAVLLIIWGEPIIGVVYGHEYIAITAAPLAIMALCQVVNVAFGNPGTFLSMGGYERDCLTTQLIALAVHIILAVFLISAYGVVGAAIGAATANVLRNVGMGYWLWHRLRLRPSLF